MPTSAPSARHILFGLALAVASCAVAPPPAACFADKWEWDTFVADIRARVPGSRYVDLTPAQRAQWLRDYNKLGEPSGHQYERVGWFSHPSGQVGMLVAGMERCVWFSVVIPRSVMEPVLGVRL